VFPDVLFLQAFLVPTHYAGLWNGFDANTVSLLPERFGRSPHHGWIDIGGPA
jgi:hypothetical protein